MTVNLYTVNEGTERQPGGKCPCPGEGWVDVWRIAADAHIARVRYLQALLTREERVRAARFHRHVHRARWVVGRALLRIMLGRYLDVEPGALRFDYGPHGKPALTTAWNHSGLCFNVSHSANLILYAVARQSVGVDVERVRPGIDALRLAQHWFSDGEYRALLRLPSPQRLEAFYAVWTRKEAYLKACGSGLSTGLDHFKVSVDPCAPAAVLAAANDPHASARWSLLDLAVGSGYKAALAMKGQGRVTGLWDEGC